VYQKSQKNHRTPTRNHKGRRGDRNMYKDASFSTGTHAQKDQVRSQKQAEDTETKNGLIRFLLITINDGLGS
jgi:nucleosome binding factor SPN SPT16 subunit